MSDITVQPGRLLDALVAKGIRSSVEEVFRPVTRISSLPTACLMEGRQIARVTEIEHKIGKEPVYMLFESSGNVRESDLQGIQQYLDARNPWEEFDLLIFPLSLRWCIGVSHNNRIVFKDASP